MTLLIDFWQLLGLLLGGLGALWGVVRQGLVQSQRHIEERLALQDTAREAHHRALAGRLVGGGRRWGLRSATAMRCWTSSTKVPSSRPSTPTAPLNCSVEMKMSADCSQHCGS